MARSEAKPATRAAGVSRCAIHGDKLRPCSVCNTIFRRAEIQRNKQLSEERKKLHEAYEARLRGQT